MKVSTLKVLFIFSALVLTCHGATQEVKLLDVHSNIDSVSLFMETTGCKFVETNKPRLEGGRFTDQFYLNPKQVWMDTHMISFLIGSITNIRFQFEINTDDFGCQVSNFVYLDGQRFKLVDFFVEYERALLLRSIRRLQFTVENSDGDSEVIDYDRFDLKDYFGLYELSIGGALNIGTSFRPNDRYRFKRGNPTVEPIPAFLVRYGPFFANNDGAGFVMVPLEKFLLLATFLIEGEPVKSEGYFPRRKSIYAGPLLVTGPLEILYYKDIKSISRGEVFKVTYDHTQVIGGGFRFSLRPFIQYWDAFYNQYYFGVSDLEGTPYLVGSTMNYGMTTQLHYDHKRWSVFTSLGFKRFGKEVRESPLVSRGTDVRLILGGLYKIF